jgi:hypothetical protein
MNVVRALAQRLVDTCDGTVEAVLLYGSHLHGAAPGRHSALDLVVVVSDYRSFYRALRAAGEIHRPSRLLTGLAMILPPNVIAYEPDEGAEGFAKCLVISTGHFERALGERPPDHFILGRLVQQVALVWAKTDEREQWVRAWLHRARSGVLAWVGPTLPDTFDAEIVGRTMMEVSYRAEFRPEAANRSQVIFENQRDHFRTVFGPLLEGAVKDGWVEPTTDGYRLVGRRQGFGRWYFARSKARVTARWFKHVFTFDKWLPYIVRKVERRTGAKVELTHLERRWPLIFLWPRVVRVLRHRPERENAP